MRSPLLSFEGARRVKTAVVIFITLLLMQSHVVKISRGKTTAGFPYQKGVRQGCNLSPLLFKLFTSDLELKLGINDAGVEMFNTRLDLLMYADDIILLSQSASGLQKHLQTLQSFCRKW